MDYLNIKVVGVFNNTNKTITIATIRIIDPEIRN
jgi:hypothetical protein